MKLRLALLLVLLNIVVVAWRVHAHPDPAPPTAATADDLALRACALDYIEGWYTGDAARMERALHPELAKRIVMTDPKTGRSTLQQMGALTLINSTRAGYGTKTPADKRRAEVTVLDRYNHAAVVKVIASDWVDYLEMAQVEGQWKIVNVLWELNPK